MKPALSIRLRLPLLICGLILGVLSLYTTLAYQQVRRGAMLNASERLLGVSQQLSGILGVSVQQLRAMTKAVADDPATKSFIRTPDDYSRTLLLTRFRQLGDASNSRVGVELWDAKGRRMVATDSSLPPVDASSAHDLIARFVSAEQASVGWISLESGKAYFSVIARVPEVAGPAQYVVQRRRVTDSDSTPNPVVAMIGFDAHIVLGNTRGDVWSDFVRPTAGPPIDWQNAHGTVEYKQPKIGAVLAAISPLRDTPWTLVIEFPLTTILAPVRSMLWRLVAADIALMLLAVLGAWILSGTLTKRLAALANAAEAMSGGDYTRYVAVDRADEIGAVGMAFNRMALRITDSRVALENTVRELGASERRYRLIFDANPQPVWVYDIETLYFLAVNDAAIRLYGFSREEFLGMTIERIRPDELVTALRENIAELGTRGIHNEVWRHRTKSGEPKEMEVQSQMLVFEGRPARIVLANDVTERQRAAALVLAAQLRLERVIASSGAVIFELRLAGGGSPVLEWISDNVTAILGYDVAATQAPDWWSDRVHPDDWVRLNRERGQAMEADSAHEYRFRHQNGTYRWLREERRIRRDAAGVPVEVVGAWLDITDHRQLELQLRHSQKMEAVGRLAGGVAHDFNNLLTVIVAECDLSLAAARDGEAPTMESFEEIKRAADRAAILTRQLLTFSRQQLIEPVSLNVNDVVTNVDKMLLRLIGEDIAWTVALGDAVGFAVADRGQLEQVLVNLVVNARDAMPSGGKLLLETAVISIDAEYAAKHPDATIGPHIMIAVTDTGSGMTDDVKSHLFEPFFTTKESGKGTGLGLATCYAIVRQFSGHIGIDSEHGRGTVVRVYLPQSRVPALTVTPIHGTPIPGGKETILLVEDEVQVRRLTTRILVSSGYRVLQASTAEEALSLLEGHNDPVDLLLTDVVLPKMNGRVLAERIRADRPGLRILLTSGYSDDVILQTRPMDHHLALLPKPFSRESLLKKVRDTLDSDLEGKHV